MKKLNVKKHSVSKDGLHEIKLSDVSG